MNEKVQGEFTQYFPKRLRKENHTQLYCTQHENTADQGSDGLFQANCWNFFNALPDSQK